MAKAIAIDSIQAAKSPSTPMMEQYLAIKAQHKDCLLFYRMGDFYELFFEDAVIAADILDIALTKRGKVESQDIPMCGVPFHSYEPYLEKLIRHGQKVAICEQMEAPEEAKKRGYKAVVRREVVRIVTPGTLTEDSLLDARQANYLAALSAISGRLALAWIDISTGEFKVTLTQEETLSADLARLAPKELLLPQTLLARINFSELWQEWKSVLTPYPDNIFARDRTEKRLKESFQIGSLDGFGITDSTEISACGALLDYIELTQKGQMPRLEYPKHFDTQHFMIVDAATRRNLELMVSLKGERKGSLLGIMDKTVTGAGARLLASYIAAPLAYAEGINARLDNVAFFLEHSGLRHSIREALKHIPDLERALSRICLNRGSPRDLSAIRDGLAGGLVIAEKLEHSPITHMPEAIRQACKHIGTFDGLREKLQQALKPEVGMLARDGGFIAPGYNTTLDHLRSLQENTRFSLVQLQEKYRKETGITTLKVTFNHMLGYFVEVTAQHSKKMLEPLFIHRQTMANALRYTTEELKNLESDIVNAKDKALKLELECFEELVMMVCNQAGAISLTASAIALLDVTSSLALLAETYHYTRPMVDNSKTFLIQGGRHPVVEQHLKKTATQGFIANTSNLSETQHLWLLTGPNMAGKSTFLRQNALITLMAQIGSFIPATMAHIGTVDRLFSRVGAADDLARGQSTFMVEMIETATILNQATEKSLVILDEIGRGTATFDGLSIAWAVVEHLHNVIKCRSLFATHYHELTSLATDLNALYCCTMRVKEWQGKVLFLHEVIQGTAEGSYGIHVAKLAGLPSSVTSRAEAILHLLENSEFGRASKELPLFAYGMAKPTQPKEPIIAVSEVETTLQHADLDSFTPKQALDFLYQLKQKC